MNKGVFTQKCQVYILLRWRVCLFCILVTFPNGFKGWILKTKWQILIVVKSVVHKLKKKKSYWKIFLAILTGFFLFTSYNVVSIKLLFEDWIFTMNRRSKYNGNESNLLTAGSGIMLQVFCFVEQVMKDWNESAKNWMKLLIISNIGNSHRIYLFSFMGGN